MKLKFFNRNPHAKLQSTAVFQGKIPLLEKILYLPSYSFCTLVYSDEKNQIHFLQVHVHIIIPQLKLVKFQVCLYKAFKFYNLFLYFFLNVKSNNINKKRTASIEKFRVYLCCLKVAGFSFLLNKPLMKPSQSHRVVKMCLTVLNIDS